MSDPTPKSVEESGQNSTESAQETLSEHAQNEQSLPAEVPGKAKRGRPRKNFAEKPADADGGSVIKRPRGRPKGSKNKNPKPKPVVTGPKRPRGRPRKWPPPDTSIPKRSRGRPRKNANVNLELPTMVGAADMVGVPSLAATPTSTVTAPIATDAVPPDDLFNNDEA